MNKKITKTISEIEKRKAVVAEFETMMSSLFTEEESKHNKQLKKVTKQVIQEKTQYKPHAFLDEIL